MIGKLYVIRNTVNDKVYIGKTFLTIEKRFIEHSYERKRDIKRHLYKAMNEIGIEKFYIELLGEYEEGLLEKEEIKVIKEFDSYIQGYNMTLGGDGKTYFSYSDQEVISKYKELKTIIAVAKYFNCCIETIIMRLKNNNINYNSIVRGVYLLDFKRSFISMLEAAKYLIDNNLCKTKDVSALNVSKRISRRISLNKKYYNYTFFKI